MKTARFVVFQDKKKQWRWLLVAANGRKLAQGEAHTRKADAERAVKTVIETIKKIAYPTFKIDMRHWQDPPLRVVPGSMRIDRKTAEQIAEESNRKFRSSIGRMG